MITYGGRYVIEGARRITNELATVQIITDTLQRLHVTVPYARSSAADLDVIVQAAIDGLNRPPKPLGHTPNGA